MPFRIGEFTTVSTSNLYFYPPLGSGFICTPQGYLLAAGSNGYMVPQNPNTLISTIISGGYLDSSISTTISSTNACLAQTSTLTTYVSINTASISSLNNQVCTISTNLQNLSNYVVANIGATPYLSAQVSSLTAGYSSLVYGFSSLSTFVVDQAAKLQSVSDSLSSTVRTVSTLSTTVSSLTLGVAANTSNLSTLSTTVSSQAASLCTTIITLSNVSTVVAGLAAGTVSVADFTTLSTYTSSVGATVSTLVTQVSTMSTQISSLQSVTTYLLNNSLNSIGVLGLLSSQNNVYFGSNIQASSVSSNLYFRGGNIGIGCNAPVYKLDVAGSSHFAGTMKAESTITVVRVASTLIEMDTTTYGVGIGTTAQGSIARFLVSGKTQLDNLTTLRENIFYSTLQVHDNVGVNCNAPVTTLDVSGSLHVTSTVTFDQTLNVSSLNVNSAISTNYIVQRTPLIWSFGIPLLNMLQAIPVVYNVTFNDPIPGYYSGGYFSIPFTGLYKIDVSANVTAAVDSIGSVSLYLSNTTGITLLWTGTGAIAGATSATTQVGYSFVSTFTSANSTKIYVSHFNTCNINTFSYGMLNIQYLG